MANQVVQLKNDENNLFPKSDSVERITLTNIHPDASSVKYFGWHNKSTGLCVLLFSIELATETRASVVLAKIPENLRPGSISRGFTVSFNNYEEINPAVAVEGMSINEYGTIYQPQTNYFTRGSAIFIWTAGMNMVA